jgi:hypothetical protein
MEPSGFEAAELQTTEIVSHPERNWIMNISREDGRKPYRPPEMAGAEYVPPLMLAIAASMM